MKKHEVYKIKKVGTDLYMDYSQKTYSKDYNQQKLYVSKDSVKKVCQRLINAGEDVEIESFVLENRSIKVANLVALLESEEKKVNINK